jgi:transcriptional regulator with XRE-family HTH domain
MPTSEHSDLPPTLGVAIGSARYAKKLTWAQLGERVGLSAARVGRLEDGRGTLATFCDVARELGYFLDVRTWEHKRLLPLADSLDCRQLCRAVAAYNHRVLRSSNSPSLPRPTENQRLAIDLAEPTCPLAAFEAYARHTGLRCMLVDASEGGDA